LHLKALEQMGAEIVTSSGYIEARAPKGGKLRGARIKFEKITVTGTENILMAASLAEGETIIENAAREPEVTDLVELLRKMGAKISGDGTSELRVHGVKELHGAEHSIIPDRIEAGTFIVASAITGGEVELTNCCPEHLESIIAHLADAGVQVEQNGSPGSVRVRVLGKLHAVNVKTEEYPGFATDMQAQFMALMTQAEGKSDIIETIFENRFMHASELIRMGADISIGTHVAIVNGPTELQGTTVIASDLRASAGLVLAALVARGDTIIDRVYHIDRGYERIEAKLAALGAQIARVS
jgi:UDP-N-acetylglucosamine 1-carboxyvinyltransferase